MPENIASFVFVMLLLTITPGIDLTLVTRSVIHGGLRAGFATTFGIVTGVFAWGTLAGIGVAAIVATSTTVFSIIKFAGAAYLIALGIRYIWLSLKRGRSQSPERLATNESQTSSASTRRHYQIGSNHSLRSSFLVGFVTDITNPQMGVLYASLLPQFIRPGESVLVQCLLLALIHACISLMFFVLYSILLNRIRAHILSPRTSRIIDGVTGLVLVGFGARLATQTV